MTPQLVHVLDVYSSVTIFTCTQGYSRALFQVRHSEKDLFHHKDAFDRKQIAIRDATFWGLTKITRGRLNDVAAHIGSVYESGHSLVYSNCQNYTRALANFTSEKRFRHRGIPPVPLSWGLGLAAVGLSALFVAKREGLPLFKGATKDVVN